jgi:tetratricopeptide (TPR) repeat protein/transcriptional regulator with XRE-family HTH domain
VAEPPVRFADVLRKLRSEAGLTQEELAGAAGLTSRAISDLERGVVTTPHKDTVRLLAEALQLDGPARIDFKAAVPGRTGSGRVGSGPVAATRTLPRDIASFTGRRHELAELVDAAAQAGGLVGIHAIGGMAGVGKTAFAVHAAHRLADRFPGGQIFLPLHGHTPGHQPVGPADALASLLVTIGIPAGQIPADPEARMALWRDRVADRPLLLILDDAASSEQVRPLLPGAGGSLVLVTSRRRLTALEDATVISLDTLPPQEAAGLLVRLAVRPGLSSADPAVAEVTRLCGYLPLAIGMLARQLHHHPAWTVARRAGELAAAVDRLELLATENVSVAAAFDLSYADLAPGQQRLFRWLGLHPGAEVDAYAAAALDGTGLGQAQRGLEVLYNQYLLTETAMGRYRMHDLIREHARALGGHLDPDGDREQATGRLLDYYQHAAALADALLTRQVRTAPARTAGVSPALVPALATREQALAWARSERANLLACLDRVAAAGQHARVIALTAGLAGLLRQDGPWVEATIRHTAAVQAARHLSDRPAQADALTNRGDAERLAGDYSAATRDLEEALGIHREVGDRRGQADALTFLGRMRQLAGNYPAATRDLEEALEFYRDIDSRLGQANAVAYLGNVRLLTGDYPGATRDLEEALGIYRELGDRLSQADALTFLGRARLPTGDYPAATGDLEEALGIYRELGDRRGQANALLYLGMVRRLTGDHLGAAANLEEALGIYRDIGDRGGEVTALNETGTLSRARGDLGQAWPRHRRALALARQIDSAWDEAHALAGLARCALVDGRAGEAEAMLRQALSIFQRIGAAEAAGVSAELALLPGAPGPASTRP